MISPHLMVICFLLTSTAHLSFPSTTLSQGRPFVDPHLPSYAPRDVLSEKLTISAAAPMEPLVRAWTNELTRQHPELMVTVTADPSEPDLRTILAHQTQIAALPRRITRIEIAEFILEYGYGPTEIPVAGKTLAVLVRTNDTGPRLSHTSAPAAAHTSEQTELATDSEYQRVLHDSHSFRRNLYLYIAQPPTTPPTQAVLELVRYVLSQQGQQWALDLGHSPLSFAEVRRITSKWFACCTIP